MQESSVIGNGGLIATQARDYENDDELHSKEQHMLLLSDDEEGKSQIGITNSIASDKKQMPFSARNNGKPKARVQKMPSLDRNYESLSTEELERFKRSSQMR